jgi:Zn-dependent M16 (insulinase) family peptidase
VFFSLPDLTWEELKQFHAAHYHPSNARFYTYGNIPLERHLAHLGQYLDRFEFTALDTAVPSEPRLAVAVILVILFEKSTDMLSSGLKKNCDALKIVGNLLISNNKICVKKAT